MFNTDATILGYVGDILKVDSAALPAWWDNLVTRLHQRAYDEIVRVLANKGYLKAQIDLWDEGASFEADLAVFYVGIQGNALHVHNFDPEYLKTFDRREELKNVGNILIAGVATPSTGTVGQPSTAPQDTGGDIFVWPDTGDGNLGGVTKW